VIANAIRLGWLTWSYKTFMVFYDLTIFFVLASFIDRWVYLDVSNLSSQGELECECEIEMFPAQMKFLMGCNL
jgi:hypothetical protein